MGGTSGAGLPGAAQSRLAGMASEGSWGSTLEVPEFAAISKVGFRPVGQVLGAAVWHVGDTGGEECPYGRAVYRREGTPVGTSAFGLVPKVQPPQGAAAIGAARPLVSALYSARRTAIDRMLAECSALGGHGVLGVSLTVGPFAEDSLEFRALGTAVRAAGAGPKRAGKPFASDLSGQDFTKLIGYGWVPAGLAMGIAVGFRHDDWFTTQQARWSAGNVEVSGYTDLVRQMRTDARNEMQLDLVRMGAEGVVVREMDLRISERHCPVVPRGKDHVVEATIVGTAITQFARFEPPPIYGIRNVSPRRPPPPVQPQVSVHLEGEEEPPSPGSPQPDQDEPGSRPPPAGPGEG